MDGPAFAEMLASGYASLCAKEEEVNNLNVFPVPDGDTGKNMRMTYENGLKQLKSQPGTTGISAAAEAFAKGMLMGARGNSGVILSQIFKGIAIGLENCDTADVNDVVRAFSCGVERSYKAVVKPVEGTMLTVFRECSECAAKCNSGDISLGELFEKVEKSCESSLLNTPNLLPVLKDAGVVDSGGAGLLCIFRGFLNYFGGERLYGGDSLIERELFSPADMRKAGILHGEDDGYGYCTEFLISLSEEAKPAFDINVLIERLKQIDGQSIVALRDGDIVKVHVHVLTPGDVLNIAQCYGEFIAIKIENMTYQHSELIGEKSAFNAHTSLQAEQKKRLNVAVVAASDDGGFKDLFYNLGADCVVSGGQSMNPSVQDFLKAFGEVNAEEIIVLPNNSNVIMAANQAAAMFTQSRVHVLKSSTLAQGYSALSIYNPDEKSEDILRDMNAAIGNVITAEITHAVRAAKVNGVEISAGDVMVIVDGKVKSCNGDLVGAFAAAFEGAEGLDDKCVITLFCGKPAAEGETEALKKYISAHFPHLEISVVDTLQPVYEYVIAIE